jgi:hypothetical protein
MKRVLSDMNVGLAERGGHVFDVQATDRQPSPV